MYETITGQEQIHILDNLYLPISYGTLCYKEYAFEQCRYTLTEAKVILGERLKRFMTGLEQKGVEILENHVKIESVSNVTKVSGFISVI